MASWTTPDTLPRHSAQEVRGWSVSRHLGKRSDGDKPLLVMTRWRSRRSLWNLRPRPRPKCCAARPRPSPSRPGPRLRPRRWPRRPTHGRSTKRLPCWTWCSRPCQRYAFRPHAALGSCSQFLSLLPPPDRGRDRGPVVAGQEDLHGLRRLRRLGRSQADRGGAADHAVGADASEEHGRRGHHGASGGQRRNRIKSELTFIIKEPATGWLEDNFSASPRLAKASQSLCHPVVLSDEKKKTCQTPHFLVFFFSFSQSPSLPCVLTEERPLISLKLCFLASQFQSITPTNLSRSCWRIFFATTNSIPFLCLSVCPSVCLSVCLSVYLWPSHAHTHTQLHFPSKIWEKKCAIFGHKNSWQIEGEEEQTAAAKREGSQINVCASFP